MAVKKTSAKRVSAKKVAARGKTKIGDSYVCGVCGLALTVTKTADAPKPVISSVAPDP